MAAVLEGGVCVRENRLLQRTQLEFTTTMTEFEYPVGHTNHYSAPSVLDLEGT